MSSEAQGRWRVQEKGTEAMKEPAGTLRMALDVLYT